MPLEIPNTSQLLAYGGLAALGAAAQAYLTFRTPGTLANRAANWGATVISHAGHAVLSRVVSRDTYFDLLADSVVRRKYIERYARTIMCSDTDDKHRFMEVGFHNGINAYVMLTKEFKVEAMAHGLEKLNADASADYCIQTFDEEGNLINALQTQMDPKAPKQDIAVADFWGLMEVLGRIGPLNLPEVLNEQKQAEQMSAEQEGTPQL